MGKYWSKIRGLVAAIAVADMGMAGVWKILDAIGRGEIVRDILTIGLLTFLNKPAVYLTSLGIGVVILVNAGRETESTATPARFIDGKLQRDYPKPAPKRMSRKAILAFAFSGLFAGVLVSLILFGRHHQNRSTLTQPATNASASTPPAADSHKNTVQASTKTNTPSHRQKRVLKPSSTVKAQTPTLVPQVVPTQPSQSQMVPAIGPTENPYDFLWSDIQDVNKYAVEWRTGVDQCQHPAFNGAASNHQLTQQDSDRALVICIKDVYDAVIPKWKAGLEHKIYNDQSLALQWMQNHKTPNGKGLTPKYAISEIQGLDNIRKSIDASPSPDDFRVGISNERFGPLKDYLQSLLDELSEYPMRP